MSSKEQPPRWPRPLAIGVGALVAYLLDVFTVHGLTFALFLTSGDGLLWPTATRILWWLIFYVATIATVCRLIWREGVRAVSGPVLLVGTAHVDLLRRMRRRARWYRRGMAAAAKQHAAARERAREEFPEMSEPVSEPLVVVEPADAPAAA